MANELCMVLKAVDYRDYDKILTLFSQNNGLVTARAPGAKSIRSALSAASQPFCCGVYTLVQKNGKFYISQCDIRKEYYDIAQDYPAYRCACLLCDVCSQVLTVGTEARLLFSLLVNCVHALSCKCDIGLTEVYFMTRLCAMLGVAPATRVCCQCGCEVAAPAFFSVEEGGVVCGSCAPSVRCVDISVYAIRVLEGVARLAPQNFVQFARESKHIPLQTVVFLKKLLRDYLRKAADIVCKI